MAGAVWEGMNLANALGFAGLGLSMRVVAWLSPSAIGGAAGADCGRLWLLVMSFVLLGIAGAWFAGRAAKVLRQRWTWQPSVSREEKIPVSSRLRFPVV